MRVRAAAGPVGESMHRACRDEREFSGGRDQVRLFLYSAIASASRLRAVFPVTPSQAAQIIPAAGGARKDGRPRLRVAGIR